MAAIFQILHELYGLIYLFLSLRERVITILWFRNLLNNCDELLIALFVVVIVHPCLTTELWYDLRAEAFMRLKSY